MIQSWLWSKERDLKNIHWSIIRAQIPASIETIGRRSYRLVRNDISFWCTCFEWFMNFHCTGHRHTWRFWSQSNGFVNSIFRQPTAPGTDICFRVIIWTALNTFGSTPLGTSNFKTNDRQEKRWWKVIIDVMIQQDWFDQRWTVWTSPSVYDFESTFSHFKPFFIWPLSHLIISRQDSIRFVSWNDSSNTQTLLRV
jgi:hypothetical protein